MPYEPFPDPDPFTRQPSPKGIAARSRILDAALAVFTERGYERATVEEIRERSGASIGSIYHHFGGKEQLAAALRVEALSDYQDGVLAELRREQGAEKAVKALVRHHLRWVDANPDRAGFLFAPRGAEQRLASEGPVRELNRRMFSAVTEWRDAHATELREMSADAFYAVVIGPAQEISRHRLAGRTDAPLKRLERELADAAWNAIRGGIT